MSRNENQTDSHEEKKTINRNALFGRPSHAMSGRDASPYPLLPAYTKTANDQQDTLWCSQVCSHIPVSVYDRCDMPSVRVFVFSERYQVHSTRVDIFILDVLLILKVRRRADVHDGSTKIQISSSSPSTVVSAIGAGTAGA